MRPILFYIGDYPIWSYRAMLALAIFAGHRVFTAHARGRNLDARRSLDLQCLLVLAGLLGSRLIEVALFWDFYQQNPAELLRFWSSGLTLYGGVLLAFVVCAAYTARVGWPLLGCLDMLAPALMLGIAVARLGCFSSGCCYGVASELPWAIEFPRADPAVPRHPTQAYEALACFAGFFILQRAYARSPRSEGRVIALFGYLYGGFRFAVEFWRADPRGGTFFGLLSFSQLVSLAIVLAALGCQLWSRRRERAASPCPTT